MITFNLDTLDFAKGGGLVTVVAQHAVTGSVLMVAHADREALERTLATREMHYRSRTRGLWHKGGTSGHTQRLLSLHADCDADAVLARVVPAGPACHTGEATCFGAPSAGALAALDATIAARAMWSEPGASYTAQLLQNRNKRLKKLGEEATELAVACADGDRERAISEAADLVFHSLVALRALGATLEELQTELARRARSD